MTMNLGPKQIFALVGAILLLLGIFIDAGNGDGYYETYPLPGLIIAILVVITLVLAVINKERISAWVIPAIGALTLLIVLSTKMQVAFAPWDDVSVWGEVLLFAGAIILLLAATVRRRSLA
jgi:hypothetical protein